MAKKKDIISSQDKALIGILIASGVFFYVMYLKSVQKGGQASQVSVDPSLLSSMIVDAASLGRGKAAIVTMVTQKLAETAAPWMGFQVRKL